jgi:hypothetical protein
MADIKVMLSGAENQAALIPVWAVALAAPASGSLARELVAGATDRTAIGFNRLHGLRRIFDAQYAGPAELVDAAFDLFVDYAVIAARCAR